jgi:hypothetical protein
MTHHQNNHTLLAGSWIACCPKTQEQVIVLSHKEFLTSDEHTIWWYCQNCANWHIFSHTSPAERSPLNLDPPR